jgi:hypothetical protein
MAKREMDHKFRHVGIIRLPRRAREESTAHDIPHVAVFRVVARGPVLVLLLPLVLWTDFVQSDVAHASVLDMGLEVGPE